MTTRWLRGGAVAALAAVAVLAAGCGDDGGGGGSGGAAAAQPAQEEVPARPTLEAMGLGRASAPPDTMVVTLNIRTDGESAAATMDEASLRAQQLLDTARAQGVAAEDLQTTNVSVFPRFDEDGRRIVGYSADNTFTVRYRDLSTAGRLLDELFGTGGDFVRLYDVSLLLDDRTSVLAEARSDAVERARAQAEQLAESAGVELGEVLRVSEVPFGIPLGGGDMSAFAAGRAAAQDAAVPVPIAPGSQEVAVQVTVEYAIG
jgi:uncharacterized protein YggE